MDKILKIVEKEIKDSIKEFPKRNANIDNTIPNITYKDAVNIEVEDMHPFIAYDVGYTQGMKCIQQIIKNINLYK